MFHWRKNPMKKNEWVTLASYLWKMSEIKHPRSPLLKELIQKINANMEVLIDEFNEDE